MANAIVEIDRPDPLDELLATISFEELVYRRLKTVVDKSGDGPDQDLYSHVVAQVERPLISLALRRTGGNQIQAAQLLGINRNTLRKKMTDHGVEVAINRAAPIRPEALKLLRGLEGERVHAEG